MRSKYTEMKHHYTMTPAGTQVATDIIDMASRYSVRAQTVPLVKLTQCWLEQSGTMVVALRCNTGREQAARW